MTRDEFEAFVENGHHMVVGRPYVIAPCACGDINCRGWKLVSAQSEVERELVARYLLKRLSEAL